MDTETTNVTEIRPDADAADTTNETEAATTTATADQAAEPDEKTYTFRVLRRDENTIETVTRWTEEPARWSGPYHPTATEVGEMYGEGDLPPDRARLAVLVPLDLPDAGGRGEAVSRGARGRVVTADGETIDQAATSVTSYVILRFTGEGGDQLPPKYDLVARDVGARSAEAAIRKHAERAKENERDGLYVAIPARSWKPTKITTKVERTLVAEDAGA